MGPRWLKMEPRGAQDGAKMVPDEAKTGQDGATMGQDGAALSVVSEPGCSPERGVKAWVQPTRRRDSWDPGVLSRGVPSEVQLQVWLEVHHPRLGSLAQCAVLAMHVRLGGEAEHAVSRELGF